MKKLNHFILFCCFFFFTVILYSTGYCNTRSHYETLSKLYQQEHIKRNYTKALEYLTEMQALAESNGWKDLKIKALSDMGLIYTDILDYDKAMACYLESYNLAVKESNAVGKIIALNNMSRQFSIENEYGKAKEYIIKAYEIACQLGDSLRIGQMAMNLAALGNQIKELDTAEKYADIALEMLKNQSHIIGLSHARTIKIENLYFKGQYSEAEQLALKTLNEFPEIQVDDIKSQFLLFLSRIYHKKGDMQKAIHFANESLENYPRLINKIDIYEHLSKLYEEKKIFSLALQYKDSAMMAKDSLTRISEIDRVLNNQVKMDLLNSEKRLAESKSKQQTDRILFISIIVVISILLLVIIGVFRMQSVRNKQNKIITENKQTIIELELEKEKNQKTLLEQQLKEQEALALLEQERLNNEKNKQLLLKQQLKEQETLALLEQERLNNEIEIKNRQLAAKVLFQSNKNELFEEVINILSNIPDQSENPALQTTIQKLKHQRNESTQNGFLTYFEQINPIFLNSLKERYPDLTPNDIRLLSYIYLSLSVKEIATLLNVLPDSLKKKKQRLANKMGIETTELYNYLANLV